MAVHLQAWEGCGGRVTRPLPRYVNGMTVKGRRYYYFRKGPGAKPIRLPSFGTPEFEIEYQKALHGDVASSEVGSTRTLPGTLNEAVVSYYKSLAFRDGLAKSSQSMRRTYLERFREKYGDSRLATMPSTFIVQMMNTMEPFSARNWHKSVRALMQHAISVGLCKVDPTQGVKLPKIKSDGFHAWSETEIAQYEAHWAVGTKQRLVLALALYTGQRRGDLVRMGRQHIRNGAIEVRQEKTRSVLEIPLHSDLVAVLDATSGQHLILLTTKSGKAYRPSDLSDEFRIWCNAAGLPSECSLHGLRKAAARRLAEAGCSAHEIAAITGHRTLKEIERYTKSADQARLARQAIARTKVTNSKPQTYKPVRKPL
jgi:integrase